jgi:hypothetical protein
MNRSSAATTRPEGTGGLIVLTGASHTGKSSVAKAITSAAVPPVARLGIDLVLDHTLVRSAGDRWENIPLAYELSRAQFRPLLRRGWTVIFESTFTYVPPDGEPQFHTGEIERTLAAAREESAAALLVQLSVDGDEAARRAAVTGRLDPTIVRATIALHEGVSLPDGTLRIELPGATPEEIGDEVLRSAPFASARI